MIKKSYFRIIRFLISRYWKIKYEIFRDKFELSPTFKFNGPDIRFYGEGRIIIDDESYIGSYSTIQARPDCIVRIGKGCHISHNVRMYTGSNHVDQDFSLSKLLMKTGNIIVRDYVWIGVNVYIGPGIEIGENSIVGANTVVTSDIPANAIVGGVPSRIIKYKDI